MPEETSSVRLNHVTLDRLRMIARAAVCSWGVLMASGFEKYRSGRAAGERADRQS